VKLSSSKAIELHPRPHSHVAAGVGIAGLVALAAIVLLMFLRPCERGTENGEHELFRVIVS